MNEPRKLGRYELVEPLGQGGMGEVWLARISGAGGFEKPCIVKTVLPALLKDAQFVQRFQHEGNVLVHLQHSNIAQVYDMGEVDGALYMALEYVAGVDVSRLVSQLEAKQEMIPVPIALFIAWQAAEGLSYAHHKAALDGSPLAIVHRDVSPQNVMVSYEGEVKVIDFGIARSAARSHSTQAATVLGKLGYMSPEQATAAPVDARADQYALGVVLWELLAGRHFVSAATTAEMMVAMAHPKLQKLPALRSEVDATLDAVVQKALATSPDERYPTTDDFARAILSELTRLGGPPSKRQVGEWVRLKCSESFAATQTLLSRVSSVKTQPQVDPFAHTLASRGVPAMTPQLATPLSTDAQLAAMRPNRTPLIAALVIALLGAAGAGFWAMRSQELPPPTPQKPPTAPEPEPVAALPVVPPIDVETAAKDAGVQAGPLIEVKRAAALFADGEKLFVRAGSDDGLKIGVELKVVGAPTIDGKRPHLGAATVLEVFPKMARLNLDESAAGSTGDRFASLDLGMPEVKPGAEKKPAPGVKVRLSATLQLVAAPKRAVRFKNTSNFTFTNCWITIPGQRKALVKSLPQGFERELVLEMFTVDRGAPDLNNEVRLDCTQGSLTLPAQ
jgi:serine/threonine protein kinase